MITQLRALRSHSRGAFVLLCLAVVVAAFAVGLAWGLSAGSGGGTAAAAPGPSAAASPPGELGLPPALFTDCEAQQVPVGTGASCTTSLAGVDQVLAVKWPSAAQMQADFATTQGGKPDGKCGSYAGRPRTGLRSTWGNGKPLACYVNSAGAAVVLWEDPATRLELLAIRKDGDTRAAFAWWQQAIKTPI
jgi:hypothetical protein